MKITISFNEEEKRITKEMMLNSSNLSEVTDKDEHYVGRFGEMKYDNNNNIIEIEYKTAFLRATAGLMVSLVNMIKSFMATYEMYLSSWMSDMKDMTVEEEKESEDITREAVRE